MEKYTRVKLLGSGSYGTATLFTTKEGKRVVIKEIDIRTMPPSECKAAEQEAKVLLMLNHPNIVSCVESFRAQGKLCIVMDFCSEGDLHAAMAKRNFVPVPEDTVLDWFVQICLGLKHVHDRQILHRDLKPQNVFMSQGGVLKLGDFGVSKVLASGVALARTAIGTPYYISPEICQNKSYNAKSDIWSLGCILYEMATLNHPFLGRNLRELYGRICIGSFAPLKAPYSPELRSLVASMLRIDPAKRPNVNEILSTPLLQKRIAKYLSETVRVREGVPGAPAPAPAPARPAAAAAPVAAAPSVRASPPPIQKVVSANGARPAAAAAAAVAAVKAAAKPVVTPAAVVRVTPAAAAAPAAKVAAPVGRPAAAAAAAPVEDVISKRQQAAQEAMRKVDELRNQEIRRREAQGVERAAEIKKADARASEEAKRREDARKAFEAAEARKRAKAQADADAARKEAERRDADRKAADKAVQDKRQDMRNMMKKHKAEWTMHRQESGGVDIVQEPVVLAPAKPPPARAVQQSASPSPSPPRQPNAAAGRSPSPDLMVTNSRGRRASFSHGDGISEAQRRQAFEDMKAAAARNKRVLAGPPSSNNMQVQARRTRSAPNSPRGPPGGNNAAHANAAGQRNAFPRPSAAPSPAPSRPASRPSSPKAPVLPGKAGKAAEDERIRAYRDMQLEAQRNKSRVAEQNNRVLDIMGRNGPSSKAPAAKQAPAAVAAAAAGAAGRGLALGPSAEERRKVYDDMRSAAERNRMQVMGNAIGLPANADLEGGISRTDSETSEDHRDYHAMIHNLKSVCADDPDFQAALAADQQADEEEVVVQAPANDGQSNAIKQRAAELRRMLQQRLGPVIFERVLQQVENSDPDAKDHHKVDDLLRILGNAHIKDLRLVFELMTYEELAQAHA